MCSDGFQPAVNGTDCEGIIECVCFCVPIFTILNSGDHASTNTYIHVSMIYRRPSKSTSLICMYMYVLHAIYRGLSTNTYILYTLLEPSTNVHIISSHTSHSPVCHVLLYATCL